MGGQWRLVKAEGLAPSPRGAHASVALGTKVLVFGGADRKPVPFSDLWLLETADGKYEWTRISPLMAAGCKLLPRSGATLTVVGGRVYLFGGTEPVSGVCFNDLKVLDTATWTWSDVEAQGTLPPARHSHCSGCLADTCLIVYGGAGYQGPMQDLWIYNTLQNSWSRPVVSGPQPQAREMHTGCMVDPTTLLVYGGRGAEFKVCCDAALFDARQMRWTAIEPTPFSRCAHSSVVLPAPAGAGGGRSTSGAQPPQQQDGSSVGNGVPSLEGLAGSEAGAEAAGVASSSSSSSSGGGNRVLIYGGYSGEAVEGDILQIDSRTLEIELVRRGPRESDKGGTVPSVRFAHSAVVVPTAAAAGSGSGGGSAAAAAGVSYTMVVFGGVNPKEDLNDVAVWALG
ncbi:hypothetical protein PLESTB_000047500 [Pleodorina starrii]|uniref:Galactose oxidase n=1 Tax=Pleodorina starrii TaxID=330485 RepID=A0A9W6B956_9CHLO|nr:hypothetical protein PLESTB_000047500 [Pleodorina starrii]GLC70569.1 hypothetical protein PLESTF_001009700 [Pleodorina starrii]